MIRIVGFTGKYGTGKTYTAVAIAYAFHKDFGVDVYANIKLRFGKKISPLKLVDDIVAGKKYNKPVIYILDEIHRYANSTRSNSNLNQFFRLWIDMIRKNNIYLFYTAQRFETVDKHIREMTDIVFHMLDTNRDTIKYRGYLEAFIGGSVLGAGVIRHTIILFREDIARLYDSNEVIPPASVEIFSKKYKEKLQKYWEKISSES